MIYMVYKYGEYVAAILEGDAALECWLDGVPEETRANLSYTPLIGTTYPFVLREHEKPNGTRIFYVLDEVARRCDPITERKPLADYFISENFYGDPFVPGGDYMGTLDHEHLGDEE